MKTIDAAKFEKVIDGKQAQLFTLKNKNGLVAYVTNFGGRIVALNVPNKKGEFVDVVLGFESLDDYIQHDGGTYYGAAIGRYGNRIKEGKFSLDGVDYQLPINNGPNSLHGGLQGFDSKVWDAQQVDDATLLLKYTAVDGEEGYPGEVSVTMMYKLTDDNEFDISYEATTDKKTLCNLTNHSYFNLKGVGNGTATNHIVQLNANEYIPVDDTAIPLGDIAPVTGTPFDFTAPHALAERIDQDNQQLIHGKGYDHTFFFSQADGETVFLMGSCYEPEGGVMMEVFSDQPGVQMYSANWTANTHGKYGTSWVERDAVCFETQCPPNSPNQANFPSTELAPGEVYKHTCIYKFSVK